MPRPTQRNSRELKPEVLRNEIVENVDQMERIEAGGGDGYASSLSVFPLVNLDDPDEEWYTMDGVRGPMKGVSFSAESPLGTLDLPSKESLEIQSYKKKYRPDKGAETELSSTPYSLYTRAAAVLRTEIFLTREQITWRGDEHVDGLIGQYGNEAHSEIPDDHVITPGTSWDNPDTASPYTDMTSAGFNIINNGMLTGDQAEPTAFMSPSVLRDAKQTADFEDRLAGVQIRSVTTDTIQELVDEEIGSIRRVMSYMPRTNENGEYIDETDTVVDEPDDAVQDNILEPYDPSTGTKTRNVVFGRPGAGSAFVPWFSERLLKRASDAPDPGSISVDGQNGFFTQVWNEPDPIGPNFKAAQEIGLHVQRGENWAILQGV